MANHTVHRTLVGGGSSANILSRAVFDVMKLDPKFLIPIGYPVIGFNGASTILDGKVVLPATFGRGKSARKITAEFLVVNVPSCYNVITGHPTIHHIQDDEMEDDRLNEKDPDRAVHIGSGLGSNLGFDLIQLLRESADIFAYSAVDMPGGT